MRILFHLAHPSKFYLFRNVINRLKVNNYHVDIIISPKDVLEDLIIQEGWKYTNLFPLGRLSLNKPSILLSALRFITTILKLEKYLLMRKRFDIIVTDDAIVVNSLWRKSISYFFVDNDIETIKINKILLYFTDFIISPKVTNIGKFSYKKISFFGNKAIAHINSKTFVPNKDFLSNYQLEEKKYIVVRTSKLNATHDINNNSGITDTNLEKIINYLIKKKYRIVIISERKLPKQFSEYIINIKPHEITDLLYYSKCFVGDSGSIATEACVLGTPAVLINKLSKSCGVFIELETYNLMFLYEYFNDNIFTKLQSILIDETEFYVNKSKQYLYKCDDINELFYQLFTINTHNP
jgi:predicted glycosyltransferase